MKKEMLMSLLIMIVLLTLSFSFLYLFNMPITGFSIFQQISQSDFESGNLNGWTLTKAAGANDWTASTTDPYQGSYHAQSQPMSTSEPASVMQRTISTSGYTSIILNYSRKLIGLDIGDEFQAEWYNGSTWIILEQTGDSSADDTSYVSKQFSLPSTANNNPNFAIRFECTAGAVSEFCRVDNVNVNGLVIDTIPPSISIVYPQNTTYNINISELDYAVSDPNLQNCWYSTNLGVTNTTITCGLNVTSLASLEGSNTWLVGANDSLGNINSSTVTFFKDTTPPNLSIISPLNQTYNNATILLNISAQDANLQATWWYNGTNNLTYISPVYYNFPQGSNTITAYANDSVGNLNYTNVTFYVDSISPSITIISPEPKTYDYNTSLPLNFTISDSGIGVQNCWYNLNSGGNITITNCQNTTFDTSEGSYILYLYANDSLGNTNSANIAFSINTQIAVSLETPANNAWINYSNIQFNYTVNTATSLKNCSLFINGIFNQINSSIINTTGGINTFNLTLTDNNYSWNVFCSNNYNSFALSNYTLNIDTISPLITISQPTGTKTSRTITASFSISDANLQSCWYNVYRGTSLEISNTTINCNSNSITFNVTVDADFTFNLYTNDSAGNQNSASSSFTVSTSSTPAPTTPPSRGGGGGGGFTETNITKVLSKLEINQIPNLIVNPGEIKKMTLNVKNTGRTFLNNCKLKSSGEYASWISSDEVKGLGTGESYDFLFSLTAPQDATPNSYNLSILIECKEFSSSKNFIAEIIQKRLEVKIVKVERLDKDNIKIIYSLEELSGVSQDINIQIILSGENNERISETEETKVIEANSKQEFESALSVASSLKGNFNLLINANSDTASTYVQEEVLLRGSPTGLAILLGEGNRDTFFTIILVVVFMIFALFIIRKIIGYKRLHQVKKIESNVTSLPHEERHY